MSTKLEDFIRDNKREFDTDRPSAGLWNKIEAELDKKEQLKKKHKRMFNIQLWAGIAASFIVVLAVTFLYVIPAKRGRLSVADVNPVYAQKQVKFVSLIEQKQDSLQAFAKTNPELYRKFKADFEVLNKTYEGLTKEMAGSPNQQMVVKAMVRNLEIQIQLLNQQLSIINEVSQYKKENSI
ncbi:hypothetical protein HDF26_004176 [Pedobacter cryoconitis]|uniref:hypothetical protein n=1 Tax=Pedobacter cryoconitis TaxID=188932 RepID=UPI001609DDA7|nr:hypothetical protein [Pedobacter cryoconitis]MBB6273716.1 hypothetical protein [Pedobacter cryoconitis]